MFETPDAGSQHVFRDQLFAGRTALITGGGSGIGLATALEFVRLGGRVAICGRSQDKLDSALELLPHSYAKTCDIRQPGEITTFVAEAVKALGTIDILVNNAGGQFPAPAENISANGFAAVVNNNLNGTFNMTREVANAAMIPAKSGCIINIIANIYRGFPGMVHTGAARAGVENMTMTLAVEWAKFGIRVNAIAPGIILTAGIRQYPPTELAQAIETIPLRRAGTAEEVAASVLFLASPASQFISGATLRLDGAHALSGHTWSP